MAQADKRQTVAFTTTYSQKVRALITPVIVTSVFDDTKTMKLNGLWDTGATHSGINKKYAQLLNLPIVSMMKVNTAGGIVDNASVHLIHLTLPNKQMITLEVTATDLVNTDLLIGMDIISQGDFAISNFNNKTMLNFRMPSIADTDFVQILKGLQPSKSGVKIQRNALCPCGSTKKYKNCCGRNN